MSTESVYLETSFISYLVARPSGVLPPTAARDAVHVAVASVHRVDYLLTWNCKHLANAQIMRRIESVCQRRGHRKPVICTPEELMGG